MILNKPLTEAAVRKSSILLACLLVAALHVSLAAEEDRSKSGLRYIIKKPSGFSAKKKTPLLLMLHGSGTSPQNLMSLTGGCTFKKKYLQVYPYAPGGKFSLPDVSRLAELVREMQEKYKITHTIAMGYSQGGYYSIRVALNYPLLINGVIAFSCGLPFHPIGPEFQTDLHRRMAIAFICGGNDKPKRATDGKAELERAGYKHLFLKIVPGLGHQPHNPTGCKAHKWMLKVFKKGGGGGIIPWDKKDTAKAATEALALAKEKKYDEALARLGKLNRKGWIVDSKNGKPVANAMKPFFTSEDKAEKFFGIRATAYAGPAGLSALKKALEENVENEEIYLATVKALGHAGDCALDTLHPLMSKDTFSWKAAKAAIGAVEEIASRDSIKPLAKLLEKIEKKGETAGLKEPVIKALRAITGADKTSAAEWKKWIKDNK